MSGTFTRPNSKDYKAAMQKILILAEDPNSGAGKIARSMFKSLKVGSSIVNLHGISTSLDDGNLSAALTIIAGFRDHRFNGYEDMVETFFENGWD